MSDQVNLFTDLFEEKTQKEIIRQLNKTSLWKWIARFLIVFGLLLWTGAVIFFDFEMVCKEVTCHNIASGDSRTIQAEEVICEYTYRDGDSAGKPSGLMKCVADGEEFTECACTNEDLKITSPYFWSTKPNL